MASYIFSPAGQDCCLECENDIHRTFGANIYLVSFDGELLTFPDQDSSHGLRLAVGERPDYTPLIFYHRHRDHPCMRYFTVSSGGTSSLNSSPLLRIGFPVTIDRPR